MVIDSRLAYLGLLAVIVVERQFELALARRNTERALAAGAVEAGASHYPWMVALHTGFLVSCVAEVLVLRRPFVPALAAVMLGLLILAAFIRFWVLRTLGERWTTRIICHPGRPVVVDGPYRFLRHPNYVAVVIEIFALPLVHGAWWTAIVFSLANLALLATRIRVEEEALRRHSAYDEAFGGN